MNIKWLMMAGCWLPFCVFAQQDQEIQDVEAHINGQKARVIVQGIQSSTLHCGLQVSFGDGEVQKLKMQYNGSKFPLMLTKVYRNPGSFVIKVEGIQIGARRACSGVVTTVAQVGFSSADTITDARKVSYVSEKQPDNLGLNCPAGWNKIDENPAEGTFSCQVVSPVLQCGTGLFYFSTGDKIGCRPIR